MCKSKTFIIANQKGGVGKTTTAMNLAYLLNENGIKTILIDADQQGNATDTYRAKIKDTTTLYDMLVEDDRDEIPIEEAIQHTEYGDIIASDPLLREAEMKLTADVDGLYRMQELTDRIEGYDAIVIDTAPAFNSTLHCTMIAADEVIIPVTADRYALQGLSKLNSVIRRIKKHQNPNIEVAGILLTKYNKQLVLSREVKEGLGNIAKELGTELFNTTIRECSKTREAQANRVPLMEYAPNCTTASDYKALADEIIKKYYGKEN